MRIKFTLLTLLIAACLAGNSQQLNNTGFETWTSPLNPDYWSTYESTFGAPLGLSYRDTADKFSGTSSLAIVSDSVPGFPAYGILPGIASYGGSSAAGGPPSFNGTTFTYRPDTFTVRYKYIAQGNDKARIIFTFKTVGINLLHDTLLLDTSSVWKTVSFELTSRYVNNNYPDSLRLRFFSSHYTPVKGSTLHIDDLHFGYKPIVATNSTFDALRFCPGGSARLTGNGGPGLTFQWLKDNQIIPNAISRGYDATESGDYAVIVSNGGAPDTSNAITVTVIPSPNATITATGDTLCRNDSPVNITVAPGGGTLSGTAISNNQFSPALSGAGSFEAVYIYTDTSNCSDSAFYQFVVGDTFPVTITAPDTGCLGQDVLFTSSNAGLPTGWTWLFGDSGGSAFPNPSHKFNSPGTYVVALSVLTALNCKSTGSKSIVIEVCAATSIEDVNAGAWHLYPTPATNYLHIETSLNAAGNKFEILNASGQVVLSALLNDDNSRVDVATLAAGTYIYRISDTSNRILHSDQVNIVK